MWNTLGFPKSRSGNRLGRLCETTYEAQQNFTLYAWFRLDNSVNEEWCGKFLSTLRLQSRFFKTSSARASKQRPESRRTCLAFDTRVSTGSIRPHVQTEQRASGQICCERWAVNIKIIRSSTIFPNKESRLVSWDLLFALITWSEKRLLPRFVHLRAEGQQSRANTRSVNFLRSSCRNQFSFLV